MIRNWTVVDDDVTKHFTLSESVCKGDNNALLITPAVIRFYLMLEEFRVWYNRIMRASNWYRTPWYNSQLPGSSPKSQHMYGVACDFPIPSDDHGKPWTSMRRTQFLNNVKKKWFELCDKYQVKGGVGFYDKHFHIDSGDEHRTHRSFWDYRKNRQLHFSVDEISGNYKVTFK